MSLRAAATAACLAAVALSAAPASAAELLSERLSVPGSIARSCIARSLGDAEGQTSRTVTVPASGWLSAELEAASGDWDLGLFDAGSGERLTGGASFGATELAQGLVTEGQRVVVQACRRSGESATARLVVNTQAVDVDSTEKVSLVKVSTPNRQRKNDLNDLGLDVTEHGGKGFVDVVLHGNDDAKALRDGKFAYTVEVPDLAKQDASDRAADARYAKSVRASSLPSGRDKYRMLEDYNNEMKTLAEQNPSIVKPLSLPFKTGEGRTVQGIEITENASAHDGKPVFLQMGVHHAREWPSGEHAMEWAYELINGYKANNPRVRGLMRATRTIVIPIVNPDGFNNSRLNGEAQGGGDGRGAPNPGEDNETVNIVSHPGEYRRKNCRLTDGSEQGNCLAAPAGGLAAVGVDPNRNYGGFWGGDGAGRTMESETYRGPGPFSEPETRNVRDLVSKRHVTTLITNHTFSNLVLRPPGIASLGKVPDENNGYKALGDAMAAENGYNSQFSYQLYDTTGTTEDWSYYATGGYGYTYEIGCNEKIEATGECNTNKGAFHPPFDQVVKEYEGTSVEADENGRDGLGNREAYFKALENTADAGRHSTIAGGAPRSAILRLTKSFDTPTSRVQDAEGREGERRTFRDELNTTTEVPVSGNFEWHINPSTRPLVAEERGRRPFGPASDPLTFSGSPAGPPADGAVPGGDASTDNPLFYNDHGFTIPSEPGKDNAKATVRIDWTTPGSDWDMKVYVDSNGDGLSAGETHVVGASEQGTTTFEQVRITPPALAPGAKFVARVVNFAATEPYDGDVSFQEPDFFPKAVESWRLNCETHSGTVLSSQDLFITRGERKDPNLSACSAALARAFQTGRGCDRATGRSRGTTFDRAKLGRSRAEHLRRFKIGIRGRTTIDRFCFTDRRQLRIGYPGTRLRRGFGRSFRRRFTTTKAVLILTSSKRFRVGGVRVGSSTRTLRRKLGRRVRGVRVGKNVWYAKKGSKARLVYKVRGRKVYEVGIADRTLSSTRARQKKFFNSFR